MRQRISDVATALFFERGFEAVTLDEIAAAAKVSKMTVWNYFSRKEELMLDREDDLKLVPFKNALRERAKGQSPVEALRAFCREQSERDCALLRVEKQAVGFWQVVRESPSLKARMRELADEAAEGLAVELGAHGRARLAAGLIVLTVRTAREEALRMLEHGASAKKANAELLALLERGLSAVDVLL
jgi:AcrR family transcriptional regulator